MKIDEGVIRKIIDHAKNDAPLEACGYLGESEGVIVEAYPMKNIDQSGEHFSFAPEEQFAVVRQMRGKGQRAAAVYHSHPSTPARMSNEDLRLAVDKSITYVIVSLTGNNDEIKAFRFKDGQFCNDEIYRVGYNRISEDP
ncbi:MAG: hypothetical protein GF401_13510 [Chitinivibrionales bacterium]|nr:hypothetical protein [Chitinivibrionales bacterium]